MFCFLNEIVPKVLFGLLYAFLFSFILDFVTHVFFLLLIKKGRNHANGQQIVDQLQEAFFKNMCICEQEQ